MITTKLDSIPMDPPRMTFVIGEFGKLLNVI